jgi:hypothetical protein
VAGVDSAQEQEKTETTLREMFDTKRAAESPASDPRFVGLLFAIKRFDLEIIANS